MRLTCGNHAPRCPGMPGKVCTVVPASGSRSRTGNHDSPARGGAPDTASTLTPRFESELGLAAGYWSRARLDG
jgi:hypothetical protein